MDKNNNQELKDKGSSVDWPPPKNTTQEDKNSKKDKQDKKITTEVKQYTIIVPDPYIISPIQILPLLLTDPVDDDGVTIQDID